MAVTKSKSKAIENLNLCTLALLSVGNCQAFEPPENISVDVRQSSYDEKPIKADNLDSGSADRYKIDITQARIAVPFKQNYALDLNISTEHMSGSSPTAIFRGDNDQAVVAMSGATISETRNDMDLTVSHYEENQLVAVDVYYSKENDYESKGGGVHYEREINDALSFSLGLNAYADLLQPTDALIYGRIVQANKHRTVLSASLTQVINKNSLLAAGASVNRVSGFLSDPYKVLDVRPDLNTQFSWALNYRHFLTGIDSAWHLDYRYYRDQFGIRSNTLRSSLHRNFAENWSANLGIRYYRQKEADFYVPYDFELDDFEQNQSSDFRLSSFSSISSTAGLKWKGDHWSVSFKYENYVSQDQSSNGIANPALLDFQRISLGAQYKF
ncbi:MAG: DUF3570 domain-containing protein [bacterium]